jgi:hypothetical protein
MSHDAQQPEPSGPRDEDIPLQLEAFHRFMAECKDCQKEIEPHWQFCAHCGTRLATQCPGCGTPLPPAGAHACPRCGLAIPQVGP